MSTKGGERERRAEELLRLWVGQPADEPAPPRRRRSGPAVAAALGIAALATIGLARYAVDLLLIGVAVVGAALLLRVLGIWLVESNLLSLGWFMTFLVLAAVPGWALLSTTEGLKDLGRHIASPIVKLLEWSEGQGWAQRVFIQPAAASPPSEPVETPGPTGTSGSELALTASATTLRAGQMIELTAQLMGRPGSQSPATVTFRDGPRPVGAAPLIQKGSTRMAYLAVALPAGGYRITAFLGTLGLSSEPLDITVVRSPGGLRPVGRESRAPSPPAWPR